MENNIIVSIKCLTYNHEPFIRQCLEGFVMQKTTFRFEAIVHDDASTDNTARIIQEYADKYPDIIKPLYENENQYSKHDGALDRIVDSHLKGKYIAICEGDDYWIDPYKLQKQVDFLEANQDFGLVHTAFDYLGDDVNLNECSEDTTKRNLEIINNKEDLIYSILDGNRYRIQTLTVLIRSDIYTKVVGELKSYNSLFLMGDTQLWVAISSYSKIKFLPEITSVYRLHRGSACHQEDLRKKFRFLLSCSEMRVFMSKKYLHDVGKLSRFQKEYKRALIKYKCLDDSYKPFIELQFNSYFEELMFKVLSLKPVQIILRQIMYIIYK